MRTRKVFSSSGVCDAWARGLEGRNGNGSLYTDGTTIWSYGSHFPIASKVKGHWSGTGLVWWNNDSYSPTTAKHKCHVTGKIRGQRIPVPTGVLRAIMESKEGSMDYVLNQIVSITNDFERELPRAVHALRAAFKDARCVKALAKFEEALRELETKRLWTGLAKGVGDES